MIEGSEREEGVVVLHLPIGPLKTHSGLVSVPRCEPSTFQPISWWHCHCAIGAGILYYSPNQIAILTIIVILFELFSQSNNSTYTRDGSYSVKLFIQSNSSLHIRNDWKHCNFFNQSNNSSHISDNSHIVNYSSNQTAVYILEMTENIVKMFLTNQITVHISVMMAILWIIHPIKQHFTY